MEEETLKWRKSILLYTTIYFLIFISIKLLLNMCKLEYMQWVYIVTMIITVIGTFAGIIQVIMKTKNKVLKTILKIVLTFIIVTCIIFWHVIVFILIFSYTPEHVVEKDGQKMVGYVNAFLKVNVYYYEYINPFIRGDIKILNEYYGKGGFDPLDKNSQYKHEVVSYTYYDENGKVIKTNETKVNTSSKDMQNTINIQNNYETDTQKSTNIQTFKVNDKVIFNVESVDAAMGKEAIQIYKSVDGGKTRELTLKTENKAIWVHYNSEFNFIDENTGFIFDPGRDGVPEDYGTVQITTNGGGTFNEVKIIHPEIIEEKNLIPEGVPKLNEKNELILKIYTINHAKEPAKTTYEFTTKDNGVTWEYMG